LEGLRLHGDASLILGEILGGTGEMIQLPINCYLIRKASTDGSDGEISPLLHFSSPERKRLV